MPLFETVFLQRVLSEREVSDMSMSEVVYQCDEGDCVGETEVVSVRKLTRGEMATRLGDLSSEPGFFNLDEEEAKEVDPRSGIGSWIFFGRIPDSENEMGIFNNMTLSDARKSFIAQLYVDSERGAKSSNKKVYGVEAYIDSIVRFEGNAVNVTKMGGE